jgi:hypothetical protein
MDYYFYRGNTFGQSYAVGSFAMFGLAYERYLGMSHDIKISGTYEPAAVMKIQACPNPFTNHVKIFVQGPLYSGTLVKIYDLRGRLLKQTGFPGNIFSWNTTDRNPGTYVVQVKTGKRYCTKKIALIR